MTRTRRLRQRLLRSRFVSAASCCGDRTGDSRLVCVLEDVTSILRDLECHYRYRKYLFDPQRETTRQGRSSGTRVGCVGKALSSSFHHHGFCFSSLIHPNYILIGSPLILIRNRTPLRRTHRMQHKRTLIYTSCIGFTRHIIRFRNARGCLTHLLSSTTRPRSQSRRRLHDRRDRPRIPRLICRPYLSHACSSAIYRSSAGGQGYYRRRLLAG